MKNIDIVQFENLKRRRAILDLLVVKPANFEKIKSWLNSNDYFTSFALEELTAFGVIELKDNKYYLRGEIEDDKGIASKI